jgi:hypothetical protein
MPPNTVPSKYLIAVRIGKPNSVKPIIFNPFWQGVEIRRTLNTSIGGGDFAISDGKAD